MNKKPYKFVEWVKHAYDFQSDEKVIICTGDADDVSIMAHPAHKRVLLNVEENIVKQVCLLPKSLQLYFFGLVWVGFCDLENDREWKVVRKILISLFEHAVSKPNLHRREMIWDDHALSERACSLLYLREITADDSLKLKIDEHLALLTINLDALISSDKWKGNNHRIFHLCAKYCLEVAHRKDKILSSKFLAEIESYFLELIDVETGMALEQSVSYYNFDIILLELVSKFICATGKTFKDERLAVGEVVKRKNRHMSALAFPDGELPASGDTPLGLKGGAPSLTCEERSLLWRGLERVGHYRGASRNNKLHYHVLRHNAESAHGHHSPLHIDLWIEGMGMVLVDSGGPYKYGDSLRYEWFRTSLAHNTITFSDIDPESKFEKIFVNTAPSFLEGAYLVGRSCFARDVVAGEDTFNLRDRVVSSSAWCLSFHFAPGVTLEKIKDNAFQVSKGVKAVSLRFFTSSDIEIENVERFITNGGGLKELSPSLVLSAQAGYFEVTTEFSLLSKVPE